MNILITGGAGFIGANFVHYVLEQPEVACLVNLDKLTYAGNLANLDACKHEARYHFVQGDIGDAVLVEGLLREHAIDAVVHFAAESHVDRSIDSPEPFFQTNVIGTLRLLDACRRYASTSKAFRFVHVSTDEVFGSLEPEAAAFTEAHPFLPNSPYAASKAASDHLARAYAHTYGMSVLTTHCSNNYGPYQFPEKLIPLMILNALEEKPLPIYGDGLNVRDWLYVSDHCSAVWRVLNKGVPGETYNIGGLNELPNIVLIDTLCALLDEFVPRSGGQSYSALKTFVPDRPGHDRRYAINCARIQRELSWQPEESFESGIRKTVRWYLDNRAWCNAIAQNARARIGKG